MAEFLGKFCLVLFFFSSVSSLVELWSTDHLDDLILSDAWRYSVPARTPAVIAIYETNCKKNLEKLLFSDQNLPNGLHLLVATYDYKKARNAPWYEFNASNDIVYRYNLSSNISSSSSKWCPIILYQPANWSLPVVYYDKKKDGKFHEWILKLLSNNVTFVNTLNESIGLYYIYENDDNNNGDIINQQFIEIIEPLSNKTINNLQVSDVISIQTFSNKLINRYIINSIDKLINITINNNIKNLKEFNHEQFEALNLFEQRSWSTRRNILNNIKTPPLMPSFTESGYKKAKIPELLCNDIIKFYNDNKSKKRVESWPKDSTQINFREVETFMVNLPAYFKERIANELRPILEEWSKTKLIYSTMYGLREYKYGAVLKNHVDRIETHVISSILHIAHEPNNISWPLEVVSFDGKKYHIEDGVCDLVLYESSKLIHGRPFPYQGSSWVNAFLHYRPIDWDGKYEFTPSNVVRTPKGEVPLVDFIYG